MTGYVTSGRKPRRAAIRLSTRHVSRVCDPTTRSHNSAVEEHTNADVVGRLRAGYPVRRAQPGEDAGLHLLAILSLATGIMATTAIYSVLHAVVLDPFPYKDVDRLMSVRVSNAARRGGRTGYSVDQFLEIAERSTIFDGVIASTISDVLWTGDGDPQRLRGNHGTFNTFDVMGVPPLIGRTPTADDARAGAEPVVVLGLSLLAAAVRRRPGRARPAAAAERHGPHRDRRHAEAVHVARRRRLSADRTSSADRSSRACATCTCSDG